MRTIIIVIISIILGTQSIPTVEKPPLPLGSKPHSQVVPIKVPTLNPQPLKEIIPVTDKANIPVPIAPIQSGNNETTIWNYLISQGFTRNQTAGIMGNLKQEHNFQTSQADGGLGIAQWIGARATNLLARANPYDVTTQLQFMLDEMNNSGITTSVKSVDSIESATMTFSSQFERCGDCRNSTRISYAYQILGMY